MAVPITHAATKNPTLAKASRAVKNEITSEHTMLAYGDNVKISMGCKRLTRTRFKCTWSGSHDGGSERVDFFGKARVRFYKYSSDVKLYDEKCFGPDVFTRTPRLSGMSRALFPLVTRIWPALPTPSACSVGSASRHCS